MRVSTYPKLTETTIKFGRNAFLKSTVDNLRNFGNMSSFTDNNSISVHVQDN